MDKQEIAAESEIIEEVLKEFQKFELPISVHIISFDELRKAISNIINHLITNNSSRLIAILYRLDISEKKLKQLIMLIKG